MTEVRDLYRKLWKKYLDENPQLHDIIRKHKGFSDIFGKRGSACQAEEIYNYSIKLRTKS